MKEKKRKIAVIGHFGGGNAFFDGQTVKTKALYRELEKEPNGAPYKVDTYYKKHNPIKLLWQTMRGVLFFDDLFVLLSGPGMRVYFPLLHFVTKIRKVRIYHDVIGGNLDAIIKNNPKFCKYLNSFTVNWVETQGIKEKIEALGIRNAAVLPNFKRLEPVPAEEIIPYQSENGVFTFCTFSRVMEEKGITDAILTLAVINQARGRVTAKLDVYGPIEESYREAFDALIVEHADCVTYRGITNSGESVRVLKDYYALLFPTKWYGEGFPGTVLDAYASAIPVIASDWNANAEIIRHGKTGWIYPCEEFADLRLAVEWTLDHKQEMDDMKKTCREEYERYTPEQILSVIRQTLRSH